MAVGATFRQHLELKPSTVAPVVPPVCLIPAASCFRHLDLATVVPMSCRPVAVAF